MGGHSCLQHLSCCVRSPTSWGWHAVGKYRAHEEATCFWSIAPAASSLTHTCLVTGLGGGGSEHQKHVLLIAGQNLNDLSLVDVDLILLHCRVIVGHQHGGDVATAATFTLQRERRRENRQRATEMRSGDSNVPASALCRGDADPGSPGRHRGALRAASTLSLASSVLSQAPKPRVSLEGN